VTQRRQAQLSRFPAPELSGKVRAVYAAQGSAPQAGECQPTHWLMKILVISLAGIGDTLIATPFIHELRANFPDAVIDAFVLWAGSKDLLEGNPNLNAIHQKDLIKEGPLKSLPFLWRLRRRGYDISINVHTLGRTHYRVVARFIGARRRLSHEYEGHGWLDRRLVNRTLPQDYSVHSVENNNRLLSLLERKPLLAKHELEIFLTPAEQQWADEYIAAHRLDARRRLGVHIGSGGTKNLRLKRWPFTHYLELIQRLNKSHPDLALLLFGGPEEQSEHEQILATARGHLVFAPPTKNLRQAAALMKHCHAFLSVDTALMHLAAAMKVPNQIVIEAPTLNPTNVPWQTNYRLVPNPLVHGRNLDYYRYDGKSIKGTDEELKHIMASVTVDEVHRAVIEAVK
jgi:ADP-heptose:LPS heptosyltransferase